MTTREVIELNRTEFYEALGEYVSCKLGKAVVVEGYDYVPVGKLGEAAFSLRLTEPTQPKVVEAA
jgi:hypothetical protein